VTGWFEAILGFNVINNIKWCVGKYTVIGANIYQYWCCIAAQTIALYIIQIFVASVLRYWIFSYSRSNTSVSKHDRILDISCASSRLPCNSNAPCTFKLWPTYCSVETKKMSKKMRKQNKYLEMDLRIVEIWLDMREMKIAGCVKIEQRETLERSCKLDWNWNKKEIHLAIEEEEGLRRSKGHLHYKETLSLMCLSFTLWIEHPTYLRNVSRHFCLLYDKKCDRHETLSS